MTNAAWATADLMDAYPERLHVVQGRFADYGGVQRFCGEIATVRVDQDWRPVFRELELPGRGRVLVVDGGGAVSRAILGERLLNTAARNGWAGVVVHGAVRDTALTRQIPTGLRALAVSPQKGESGAPHERDVTVSFAGASFVPGEWLWADADGMVIGPAAT